MGSASRAFYQDNSLTKDALPLAIQGAQGGRTVATVNENGTPNIAVFAPGVRERITFVSPGRKTIRKNVLRTKQAVLSYFIYPKDEAEKEKRNRGARVVLELETDENVISQLRGQNPDLPDITIYMKIAEVLPLG